MPGILIRYRGGGLGLFRGGYSYGDNINFKFFGAAHRYSRVLLKSNYCRGKRTPLVTKKIYLPTGPETRRKRSACSTASKCDIERVPY